MTEPIRVAAVGFWHVHAAEYAAAAQQHPRTELVAVWDDDEARGRAAAADVGVPFEPDLDALVVGGTVDAVTVTTATTAHPQVIGTALRAGRHVFTEKLLAATVEECVALVESAAAGGAVLVVSLPRLAQGPARTVSDLVDGGRLGRVTAARVRLAHDGAVRDWLPDRFYDPAEAVGGALTDLGCHPVYLVQRFLGAEPTSVSATYAAVTGRAVEDSAVVTVATGDGAIGVAETGFVSVEPFAMDVAGTLGSASYREGDGHVRVTTAAGVESVPLLPDAPDPFAQWVSQIDAGTTADENLDRAVHLTRLVVAANRSAADGVVVRY